jgi:hypothetical protein
MRKLRIFCLGCVGGMALIGCGIAKPPFTQALLAFGAVSVGIVTAIACGEGRQ